jgi:hypothetical protein
VDSTSSSIPRLLPSQQFIVKASTLVGITVQWRWPRSHRKRMRKKWRRNPHNFHNISTGKCIQTGNIIVCHPHDLLKVREKVKDLAYAGPVAEPLLFMPMQVPKFETSKAWVYHHAPNIK